MASLSIPKSKIQTSRKQDLNMKHKTTWAIAGLLLAFVLVAAFNALIVWALTSLAILPIADALGHDLPFWPVFILLWFATGFISNAVRQLAMGRKGDRCATPKN